MNAKANHFIIFFRDHSFLNVITIALRFLFPSYRCRVDDFLQSRLSVF